MKKLSTAELLFDRQESFNDIVLCLEAKSRGIGEYQDRIEGNLNTINVITKECKRRGFDPAIYQENNE